MNALQRKLLRTVKTTRGQFTALVIIVMLGVLVYIAMGTAYLNLRNSKEAYFHNSLSADYYFHIVKGPEGVIKQIEAVPGIIRVTGRIQKDVPIIKPDGEKATARLTGYPYPMDTQINRIYLLAGRMFSYAETGHLEMLLDPMYAAANEMEPGSLLEIVAEGRKTSLLVTGTGITPEFVYPVKDAATMMPEPDSFAVVMLAQRNLQQVLNMPGQINQVLIQLAPGTDPDYIKRQVEHILQPYGNIASYSGKDQVSSAYLNAELEGLETSSRYLPLIFFLLAASIQFVILKRLIDSQRTQIGIMKALGYTNASIILHYTGYAMLVSLCGTVLGIGLGIMSAGALSNLYAQFFNLPELLGSINLEAIFKSLFISLTVGVCAGFWASWSAARIEPAEAMRAQPPVMGHKTLLEQWDWLWRRLDSSWRMSLRSIFRNYGRFLVTVMGVMTSVILLVLALFSNDAVDYMMTYNFNQVNRYDYQIKFITPIAYNELHYWRQWEEIMDIEPVLEVPVKIYFNERSEDDLLLGLNSGNDLKRVIGADDKVRIIPEEGIILSKRTADRLGVVAGDMVRVETVLGIGPGRTAELKVMEVVEQIWGSNSFISYDAGNRILQEKRVVTAVLIKLAQGHNVDFEKRLIDMNNVGSIISRQKELESYESIMGMMIAFIGVMILFAGLLGVTIIYNSAIMTFNERKRELASLQVLGFTIAEISALLMRENWLQSLLGIVLGLPLGRAIGALYMTSISTDLYSFPVVIYPRTYVISAVIAVVVAWMGQRIALNRMKDLDMAEALKNRD